MDFTPNIFTLLFCILLAIGIIINTRNSWERYKNKEDQDEEDEGKPDEFEYERYPKILLAILETLEQMHNEKDPEVILQRNREILNLIDFYQSQKFPTLYEKLLKENIEYHTRALNLKKVILPPTLNSLEQNIIHKSIYDPSSINLGHH